MTLEFRKIKRSEIRQAAELAARSFDDYEYFTNWFPDKETRNAFQLSAILHEYRTNFGRAEYLMASQDSQMVAVCQLNPPSYRKPSGLSYLLHGWLNVFKTGEKELIDKWLEMDAAAGRPCHEYQKKGPGIWYASSLTVDPLLNVFFLTAFPQYSLNAWKTGVSGFLEKPLNADNLRSQLARLRRPIEGVSV